MNWEELIESELRKCPYKVERILYPNSYFCALNKQKVIYIGSGPKDIFFSRWAEGILSREELYFTQVLHEIGHSRFERFSPGEFVDFGLNWLIKHEQFAERYTLYRLRKLRLHDLSVRYIKYYFSIPMFNDPEHNIARSLNEESPSFCRKAGIPYTRNTQSIQIGF